MVARRRMAPARGARPRIPDRRRRLLRRVGPSGSGLLQVGAWCGDRRRKLGGKSRRALLADAPGHADLPADERSATRGPVIGDPLERGTRLRAPHLVAGQRITPVCDGVALVCIGGSPAEHGLDPIQMAGETSRLSCDLGPTCHADQPPRTPGRSEADLPLKPTYPGCSPPATFAEDRSNDARRPSWKGSHGRGIGSPCVSKEIGGEWT